jgi:hypothetical protein
MVTSRGYVYSTATRQPRLIGRGAVPDLIRKRLRVTRPAVQRFLRIEAAMTRVAGTQAVGDITQLGKGQRDKEQNCITI